MPLYEYRCTSCHQMFEKIQRFSDPLLETCEVCSGSLEKLVSRTGFLLKGGGWFSQGYGASASAGPEGGKDKVVGKPDGSSGSGEAKAASGGCAGGGCGCKH